MIVNPGIRRFLGSAIQRLFNSASFYAPLTHSLVLERGTGSPTFTRATTSTWPNNDGYLVTGVAGEIGFVGARRVRNFSLGKTEDLTVAGGWGLSNITTPGLATVTAPDGTTTGWVLTATANSAQWYRQCTGMTPNGTGLEHIWLRRNTGSGAVQLFNAAGAAAGDLGITTSWAQYSLPVTITAGGTAYLGIQINVSGDKVEVWHPQLEDVTAQTTQTAGEYVSVGALDYRSELNRLYLSLPGTAGHYASTPDSVANSITGDIKLQTRAMIADVSPATNQTLIAKWTAAPNLAYLFRLQTDGKMYLYTSADGSTTRTHVSSITSAAAGLVDGANYWFKVTRSASTGVVKFYFAADTSGTPSYTQWGADVAGTVEGLADTNAIVTLGFDNGSALLNGRIYSAQIYNTIGGTTPVVDFNPHRDATTPTGTITSSTTGEVWTINGASSVIRSDYYHGSFVDGVACFDYYYLD